MFLLKACPRCSGDLREDSDKYGRFLLCLQCGYHKSDTKDTVPEFMPVVSRRCRPRKIVVAE